MDVVMSRHLYYDIVGVAMCSRYSIMVGVVM